MKWKLIHLPSVYSSLICPHNALEYLKNAFSPDSRLFSYSTKTSLFWSQKINKAFLQETTFHKQKEVFNWRGPWRWWLRRGRGSWSCSPPTPKGTQGTDIYKLYNFELIIIIMDKNGEFSTSFKNNWKKN